MPTACAELSSFVILPGEPRYFTVRGQAGHLPSIGNVVGVVSMLSKHVGRVTFSVDILAQACHGWKCLFAGACGKIEFWRHIAPRAFLATQGVETQPGPDAIQPRKGRLESVLQNGVPMTITMRPQRPVGGNAIGTVLMRAPSRLSASLSILFPGISEVWFRT